MAAGTSYLDALGQFLEHPIDSTIAALTPSEATTGISIDGSFIQLATPADSVASAAVRATGIDPGTGLPVNPNYTPPGYDPQDPQGYMSQIEASALGFYNNQLSQNNAANAAADSFLPHIPGLPNLSTVGAILILLVVGFLLIEAVK
jgi:hypothetical protein